jgi:hypothetical protein
MGRERLRRLVCVCRSFAPVAMFPMEPAAMERGLVCEAFGPQKLLELDEPGVEGGAGSGLCCHL